MVLELFLLKGNIVCLRLLSALAIDRDHIQYALFSRHRSRDHRRHLLSPHFNYQSFSLSLSLKYQHHLSLFLTFARPFLPFFHFSFSLSHIHPHSLFSFVWSLQDSLLLLSIYPLFSSATRLRSFARAPFRADFLPRLPILHSTSLCNT